jgi:hypothetical protein
MHDILSLQKRPRGQLKSASRPDVFAARPHILHRRPMQSTVKPSQSHYVLVGDIVLPRLAQPHLLDSLTEHDVYIHEEIEVMERREFEPEKLAVFERAHRIIDQDKKRAKLFEYLFMLNHPVKYTKFYFTH